ncbi:YjzD family protein [Priestia abyssalis]|uniref:YjzD family protein n=1 Tax=Priestia abyssalis TaxID=1221450 RepID=UPI0009953F89|nr:YjzD family protein [Priestia abyssalis]
MRIFWTFFWSLVLINMSAYVVSSMQGFTYDFVIASIISVVFSVFVIILGEALIPNEPVDHH